jgi:hypothetical protein
LLLDRVNFIRNAKDARVDVANNVETEGICVPEGTLVRAPPIPKCPVSETLGYQSVGAIRRFGAVVKQL